MSNRNLAAFVLALIGFICILAGFGWALSVLTLAGPLALILSGAVIVILAILIHQMEI